VVVEMIDLWEHGRLSNSVGLTAIHTEETTAMVALRRQMY